MTERNFTAQLATITNDKKRKMDGKHIHIGKNIGRTREDDDATTIERGREREKESERERERSLDVSMMPMLGAS